MEDPFARGCSSSNDPLGGISADWWFAGSNGEHDSSEAIHMTILGPGELDEGGGYGVDLVFSHAGTFTVIVRNHLGLFELENSDDNRVLLAVEPGALRLSFVIDPRGRVASLDAFWSGSPQSPYERIYPVDLGNGDG